MGGISRSLNTNYVLTSFAIGFLSCYVAIGLCEQLRSSYIHGEKNNLSIRMRWLLLIGIAIGGSGMFCMHFIGMCALNLTYEDTGESVDLGYNQGIIIASLFVGVISVIAATAVASEDHLFAKTKAQIIESFILHAGKFSMTKIKKIKDSEIIQIISTRHLTLLFIGGILAGGGKSVMHYMGFIALEFGDNVKMEWIPGMVVCSVSLALIGATLAYWMLFRLLSIFPSREFLRITSAFTLTTGLGMSHYLGMYAVKFTYVPNHHNVMTKDHLNITNIIPVVFAALVVLWALSMVTFYDLRRLVFRYRNFITKNFANSHDTTAAMPSIFEKMSDLNQASNLRFTSHGTTSQFNRPNQSHMMSSNNNFHSHNNYKPLRSSLVVPITKDVNLFDIEEGKKISDQSSQQTQETQQINKVRFASKDEEEYMSHDDISTIPPEVKKIPIQGPISEDIIEYEI